MLIQNAKTGGTYEIKNIPLLPFFYLIPRQALTDRKEYINIPRNPIKAVLDNHWRELIDSDDFKLIVADLSAFFIWESFGVSPYIHCFSGHDPLFKLAYMLDLWADSLNVVDLSVKDLLQLPVDVEMPWLSIVQSQKVFYIIGNYSIDKHNLRPVIDCVKQHRCHEDYDDRMSNPKKDFYRKWYHSRAMTKVVSIEELMKKAGLQSVGNEEYYSLIDQVVEYNNLNSEHTTIYKMDLERYLNRLDDKDTEILALKYSGYTQNEIADRLGYKTHSAVGKRISGYIRKEYLDYFAWDPGLNNDDSGNRRLIP